MPRTHVVLEDGGRAVRCRTIERRPKDARCDGKTISGIVATPASQTSRRQGRALKCEKPEPWTKPEARPEEKVVRRNFRITNRIMEKYGHTPGCIGCEAALASGARCPPQQDRQEDAAAPEVLHVTGRDQKDEETHDDKLTNEDGGPGEASHGVPELVWKKLKLALRSTMF